MKNWEEEDVIEKLCQSGGRRRRSETDEHDDEEFGDEEYEQPWLLILAQKVNATGDTDFQFYLSDNYERLAEFLTKILVRHDDIPEDTVWVERADSSRDDEEDENKGDGLPTVTTTSSTSRFQPHFVAKALFNPSSTSHEALNPEGSAGWRLAVQQKYQNIRAACQERDAIQVKIKQQNSDNDVKHTAAKAAAAAALGGSAAVGGTSAAAAGLGYGATGIAANSWAAAIMASEAVASGGGVAAGGFTATMQSIGAAGVMASPVGWGMLAGGALLGGACYFAHHQSSRNKKDKKAQMEEAEVIKVIDENTEYNKLDSEETAETAESSTNAWVIITVHKQESEDSEYTFMHRSYEDKTGAEARFLEISSNVVAKALFNPHGLLIKSEADDTNDDGWETAMALNYDFALAQGLIVPIAKDITHACEATPLLRSED